MTSQDPKIARKIARLMRAARKRKRFTQQAVANRLGISQGALSKMENGYLIPSAPQWFEFCDMTEIEPVSLKYGFIDRTTEATLEVSGEVPFKMPKNFLNFSAAKVRVIRPLLDHFQRILGENSLKEYLKSIRVDPDFFVEYDNQTNIQFIQTLVKTMIQKGALSDENFAKLKEAITEPENHGLLARSFEKFKDSSKSFVDIVLEGSRYYDFNFSLQKEDESSLGAAVSVTPREHMSNFNYRNDPDLQDFHCRYSKMLIEGVSKLGGLLQFELKERQCHYQGADRCVYELSV